MVTAGLSNSDPVMEVRSSGLSLTEAIAVGVNTTSPAYSLAAILAPMALLVGYSTPIVLVVSFIPMALTSVAFMYLNRRDPDCGTTFSWVTRALGAKPGFLAGWVIAACGVLVLGSLAQTAVEYGLRTFGLNGLAENRDLVLVSAALLILVMVLLSIVGSDWSARFQTAITFAQISILLLFALAAGVLAYIQGLPSFSSAWINPFDRGVEPLVAAMLLGVFAFWGWEAATNLAEECRKPTDAGKAGLISTVILLGTYVMVAITVVLYLGRSGFHPVGESGLVMVDMSSVALGPFAVLVLLAVFISAMASTQSTLVPGSRVFLSMARRGALPARIGLMYPRFKTPWVSLLLLGTIAAVWFIAINLISESAMIDTLSALGTLVAFYYSITGIACIVYYRRHVVGSVRGFLLVGVGPLLGSIGLLFMLIVGVQALTDEAVEEGRVTFAGLAPPLAIAATIFFLGVVVMAIRMIQAKAFFRSPRQVANALQSPFILPSERPIPLGGILIDCNHPFAAIVDAIDNADLSDLPPDTPIYLVAGVVPPELSGVEEAAVHNALIDDASHTFLQVQRYLKGMGLHRSIPLYEESDARKSVASAQQRTQASRLIPWHVADDFLMTSGQWRLSQD